MKKITLRLSIEVSYDLGADCTAQELRSVLLRAGDHLAANGLLTGEAAAEVETWSQSIDYLDESDDEDSEE